MSHYGCTIHHVLSECITMKSTTEITILPQNTVLERQEQGLWVPTREGRGLQVVDCSDDRPLTDAYYAQRTTSYGVEIYPGRYFGAASGVALAGLVAFAAEHGERAVKDFVTEFSAEAFTDFAADLSDRAMKRGHIELNQHSAEGNEENDLHLANHTQCENGLGCAFAALMGKLLHGTGNAWEQDEADRVNSELGATLELTAAKEGLAIMQRYIPEDFGIHRGALHHAQTRSPKFLPLAMHKGHHADPADTAVVIDLAGYRSNANRHTAAGVPRYHHTPSMADTVLRSAMPEMKLDPKIIQAAGVLLGCATRKALSGEDPASLKIELIPEEYSSAA